MTAQVIGRSKASLVVLGRHLWLNLTEMKDAHKVPFLDSLVSPTGLFGAAVEGFAEHFTAAQKSSQAMRHFKVQGSRFFLPKRSSSAAVVPWYTEWVLRTLPCYVAAQLSRRFSRSNLRSLGECSHYIARCPAHSGGLSSHRLCISAAEPLVHFQRTAQTNGRAVTLRYSKKGFSIGEKGVSPSVLNKTQYSFLISGNRGYVSNLVRFYESLQIAFPNMC